MFVAGVLAIAAASSHASATAPEAQEPEASAASAAASAPGPHRALPPPIDAANTCASCHATLTDPKLRAPAKEFSGSVHRDERIGCVGCHKGDPRDPTVGAHSRAMGFVPHPDHSHVATICGGCHSDAAFMRRLNARLPVGQAALFNLSLHGKLSAAGDDQAPNCAVCHGKHEILPPSSPRSPVNRANVAKLCSSCHSDPKRMVKYDLHTDQYAKWEKSVHGQAFRKGNPNAPTCTGCHGAHSATPPDASSVGRACGRCHEQEMGFFEQSPHSRGFRRRGLAECVACHSNHDVAAASSLLVGTSADATCMKCHSQDEKPRKVADEIAQQLRGARARRRGARHRRTREGIRAARRGCGVRPRSGRDRRAEAPRRRAHARPVAARGSGGSRREGGRRGRTARLRCRTRAQSRAARLLWRARPRRLALRDARPEIRPARQAPKARFAMNRPESAVRGSSRSQGGGRRRVIAWAAPWLVLVVVALLARRTHERVEHDAEFCATSCHHEKDRPDRWHTGGHAKTECQSCHVTPFGVGLKLAVQSITHPDQVRKHGKVDPKTCESCHAREPAEWRLVAETEGHRQHRGAKDVDCLSCHAASAHEKVSADRTCAKCHDEQRLHKPTTENAETCLSCHSFAVSEKLAKKPTSVACTRCHASPAEETPDTIAAGVKPLKTIDAHVLHGGVACQLCHNAHGKKPKAPEGQPICARCHQFEMFEAGAEVRRGPEGHRNCEGCHKPHAPLNTALQSCVNCHEKNAKGLVPSAPAGKTTALKHESCASCHQPHTWKAERSGCMQCHEDKANLILHRSPEQHNQCTNCHEVHGAPPSGSVCLTCHAKTKGNHVARAPQKHKDCTSCHNPHAPLPEDTRTACAKCHTTQLSQVMRDGPDGHAKDTCFGCHQPHENPLPPANVCGKCHGEKAKAVSTAAPPKHRVCTSCHQKHKFKIDDPKVACAQCHATTVDAIRAEGPHQGECKSCHTLHGSPGIEKKACFQCHDKVQAQFKAPNETHARCKSCHEPHKPAKTAIARCGSCHEAKATVAAAWPANSPHQQACNGCHQQHDVRNKKACASCHEKEGASAMGGKHQCTQCHPPHNAPPGRGSAWWSRCSQCHADKVESAKARGPKHSVCSNCHQPHRFAVPKCAQCHQDMSAKGLHGIEQHAAKCTACHDPHVKAEPSRAQCLACHTNRREHQPDAQKCQACHMFQ